MNILFLFCSLPDLSNKQGLWASLIHEFVANGHHVMVSSKGKKKTKLSVEAGIPVLRIGGPEFTAVSNNVKKALAYQQYVLKQRYFIKKLWGKEQIDLIISHSLPPELAYVVGGLKRHFKCPFYLIQSDYTWQDAVAYGFFGGKSFIARYYQFWERKAFELADYIGVPTKGNVSFARQLYPWLKEDIFSIYPFWQRAMGVEKEDCIKGKYGLESKFVVMYGGNVGPAQRIENLIYLAEQVQDYKDICFLILGKGSRLPVIQQMVAEKHLENVIFKPFLPQQDYLQLLAACDAGLIMLNEVHATPNFPSKTMSYFDLQIPVLAAIDQITDYGQFLEETGTGLWSYSGDTKTFKNNLLRLYNDSELVSFIKNNEAEYFKKYMQPKYAYNKIITQIEAK